MNRKLLLILPIVIILAIIGLPLYFDSGIGNETLPDSPMYGFELIGENIKCALTVDRKSCLLGLADERMAEAAALKQKLNSIFDKDETLKYRMLIVQTENAASRLRIEALS